MEWMNGWNGDREFEIEREGRLEIKEAKECPHHEGRQL